MYSKGGLKCLASSALTIYEFAKEFCFCIQKGCLLLANHVKLVVAATYVVVRNL